MTNNSSLKPHWILATYFETWRKAEKGETPKKQIHIISLNADLAKYREEKQRIFIKNKKDRPSRHVAQTAGLFYVKRYESRSKVRDYNKSLYTDECNPDHPHG